MGWRHSASRDAWGQARRSLPPPPVWRSQDLALLGPALQGSLRGRLQARQAGGDRRRVEGPRCSGGIRAGQHPSAAQQRNALGLDCSSRGRAGRGEAARRWGQWQSDGGSGASASHSNTRHCVPSLLASPPSGSPRVPSPSNTRETASQPPTISVRRPMKRHQKSGPCRSCSAPASATVEVDGGGAVECWTAYSDANSKTRTRTHTRTHRAQPPGAVAPQEDGRRADTCWGEPVVGEVPLTGRPPLSQLAPGRARRRRPGAPAAAGAAACSSPRLQRNASATAAATASQAARGRSMAALRT